MHLIKRLCVNDVELFRDTIIRFIYESTTHTAYTDSFVEANAKQKYDELVNYLNEGKAIAYGSVEDNALIGFVCAYEYPFREDTSRVYISILHVDAQYRGREIGNYLLSKIEDEATKQGYGSVFLYTEYLNEDAIQFYNRMGYVVERIQLVKKQLNQLNLPTNRMENNSESVQLLTAQVINKYKEALTELFLINTKAHILTKSFDYAWAAGKINDLIGYTREKKAVVAGCLDNDRLIGFMWVFPYRYRNEERYMINAVVVLPEYRNKRIASKLFEIIESAISNDKKALYTHVDAGNKSAYRFYINHGMENEGLQLVKRIPNE